MDLRDLLKGGSLAVIGVVVAFYICGWQYDVGFFHALGVKIHFFIPPESAVGAGMQPMVTILGAPLLGFVLASFSRTLAVKRKPSRPWLTPTFVAAWGGFPLPWIIERVEGSQIGSFDLLHRMALVVLGTTIAALAGEIGSRNWMRKEPARYYYYFAICLCFLVAACVYSSFRGEMAAGSDPYQLKRALAMVSFQDEQLQAQCGAAIFQPLLSIGDDIYLLEIKNGAPSSREGLCGMPTPKSRPLIIVKRNLVKMLSLVRQPGT